MSFFKFQPGDRVEVIDQNSPIFQSKGIIRSITFNSIFQDWEYIVKWAHKSTEEAFEAVGAENAWGHDLASEISGTNTLFKTEELRPESKKECNHTWKWYNGFNESYEYCTVCDAKIIKKA